MGRMMRPEFLVNLAGTVHAVIAEKFVDRVSPFGNPAIYFWAQDVHTGQIQERNQRPGQRQLAGNIPHSKEADQPALVMGANVDFTQEVFVFQFRKTPIHDFSPLGV